MVERISRGLPGADDGSQTGDGRQWAIRICATILYFLPKGICMASRQEAGAGASVAVASSLAHVSDAPAVTAVSTFANTNTADAASSHASGKLLFAITNNMHDETKLPLGWPSTKRQSVLAWHSQLTIGMHSGPTEDHDVLRPPKVLKAYNGATVWTMIAQEDDTAGMRPQGDALPQADYYGFLSATDSHSVNKLLSKFTIASLQNREYHICSLCTQHRTGSVCEEVSKQWGLLPPSFCLASQMRNADFHEDIHEGVAVILSKFLQVEPAASGLAPRDSGLAQGNLFESLAEELLALCYVAPASNNQKRDEEEVTAGIARRKEVARAFLQFFPPPWSGSMIHVCPPGCCGPLPAHDRATSVARGTALIMQVVFPRLELPAANRYTKIFPVVSSITLMLHFYKVMEKVLKLKLKGLGEISDDDPVLQAPNALVGAPDDAMLHQRKVQEKQRAKLALLVADRERTPMLFLVWLCVVKLIMPLHYRLFKRGVFYSHASSKPEEERRFGCFEFCSARRNPALKVLTAITAMLFDPNGAGREHLSLLLQRYGTNTAEWPSALPFAVQSSLLTAYARLWRLLVDHFLNYYPWKLAPFYDPASTVTEKHAAGQEFVNLSPESPRLDPGLGRRVRSEITTVADLAEAGLFKFLQDMFLRVVVTSTYVERVFKNLTAWTAGRRQKIGTVQAKHCYDNFNGFVEKWRANMGLKEQSSGQRRPSWASDYRVKNTNGWALFRRGNEGQCKEPITARETRSWHELTQAERAEWRAKARSKNTLCKGALLARTQETLPAIAASGLAASGLALEHEHELDPPCGPWNIASARGKYPLHVGAIAEQQSIANMIETERMWNATWEPKITATKDVPSITLVDGPISTAAAETPKNCEDIVAAMLRIVRYSLKYGVETDSPLGMLFEFRDGETKTSKYAFVSHYQSLETVNFEAEFLRMQPIHEEELPELSFNRIVSPGTEQPLLDISTERDFVVSLVRGQSEPRVWDVYNLSWTVLNMRPRAALGW